jgi:hypothetical protein
MNRLNAGQDRSNPTALKRWSNAQFWMMRFLYMIRVTLSRTKVLRFPLFAGNAVKAAAARRVSLALSPAHAALNTAAPKHAGKFLAPMPVPASEPLAQCVFLDSALLVGDSRYAVNQKVLLPPSSASTWSIRAKKSAWDAIMTRIRSRDASIASRSRPRHAWNWVVRAASRSSIRPRSRNCTNRMPCRMR